MSLPCRLDHSFDGYAYRAFGVLKVKNRVFHEVMKRLPHSRGLNNFVLSIRFGGRHHPPDPPPIPSRFEINLEVKEEAITEDIKKATLEDVDAIVKAKVEEAVGDVKKAFDGLTTDVAELKKAVDEMKNTIVRKSGPLVYIPESEGEYNPYEANAAAIGA